MRRTGGAQRRLARALLAAVMSSAALLWLPAACGQKTNSAAPLLSASPTNVVLDWNAQANVITRGILNADLNSGSYNSTTGAWSQTLGFLEQPLPSQTASRMLALLNTAMLETLNVLTPGASFKGNKASPLVPASAFAASDLAAAVPAAAASFAGHAVLATLFPSRQQALPPFLDSVIALHLSDARFSINLVLPASAAAVAASQAVGTKVARVVLATKLGDGFATLKTYSFNQTLAATSIPPLNQYRATGIYPASFSVPPFNVTSSAAAFVYPQLQSVTPFVAAAGKDWSPNTKTKVLGAANPAQVSPFFKQAVTGTIYPNTLPTTDSNAILGLWFNVSNAVNSTAAPDWAGYNFSTAAYPDPLYNAAFKASLQSSIGVTGLAPNAYYADLNQVRWLGQRNSVYRSQKQTNLAYFWRLGPGTAAVPGTFSNIATTLLVNNATGGAAPDLYASAALLTRMHVAIWDGSVAGWTAKYKFLQWRPETALRYGDNSSLTLNTTSYSTKALNWPSELTPVYATPAAATDGTFTPLFNASGAGGVLSGSSFTPPTAPATALDGSKAQFHAAWWPELVSSPGHPEYPSTHAVACEAAVTTLRLYFGTDVVAAINNGSSLALNSEDTYLGNGAAAGPGDGGRAWAQSGSLSSTTLYYVNVSGVAGAGGAADTAPYAYKMPLGLQAVSYATLSQLSRDCGDSRVYGGVHFNSSVNDGMFLGNTVASFVYAAYPGNLTKAVGAALALLA